MNPKREKSDVGVIVGRFHVDVLHEAHKDLIESVIKEHDKVIVFLGLSPCRGTRMNPLDFESRKQLLLSEYPELNVLYIKDVKSDDIWSKCLDSMISDLVGPTSTVMLYGSRDSFIKHYTTQKYPTCELEQEVYVSGTEIRKSLSAKAKSSPDWRAGAIWQSYNQYPKCIPTVDVAIWNDKHTRLLLARKEHENGYRFIGGFAQNNNSYEAEARREVAEEAHIEISDPKYIGSYPIDDWRYRCELDNIVTMFFESVYIFGKPVPDDDIIELKWFDFDTLTKDDIVDTHHILFDALKRRSSNNYSPKVGVAALIKKDNKYLLGKRKDCSHGNGLYHFPGGHIDEGETMQDTVIREVKEETGLDIDIKDIKFLTARDEFFEKEGLRYITLFFSVDYKKKKEPMNFEPDKCEGWKWYGWNEIPDNLMPATRKVLDDFYS